MMNREIQDKDDQEETMMRKENRHSSKEWTPKKGGSADPIIRFEEAASDLTLTKCWTELFLWISFGTTGRGKNSRYWQRIPQ